MTLGLHQHLRKLVLTPSAAGSRPTGFSQVFYRSRSLGDVGADEPIRDDMTEANNHAAMIMRIGFKNLEGEM
ncbi:uncharacterized protein STAUR_1062 [Stigmatella aurantiaca DW4/3-1]|uniref:Uncharacterized protein n=1 Tax=Stigmatella aurantiaca (strain DW4/3-1) TaxID=378806 RepID=E3FEN5_STIAD|nr:uncharacterized protein STAUR_1062 [Stigmatella aurantiaca DW4/3-1]